MTGAGKSGKTPCELLIFARVPVRCISQFGQDPLILNQKVGTSERSEIRFLEQL